MEITIKHRFSVSPKEMAQEFWDMGMDEQADFFNELSKISKKYNLAFNIQIQALRNSGKLTEDGKKIMMSLGGKDNGL